MFNTVEEALIYLYNRYNIEYDKQLSYKNAFLGMLTTLGFPKTNSIEEITKFFDNNINNIGLYNIRKLYCNIDKYSPKSYVDDLKDNYMKFDKDDDFDSIEMITKQIPLSIKNVDDMINISEMTYRNIKAADYGIAYTFFKNKIPASIFATMLEYRKKQMFISKSNISYICNKIDNISYETVRVWDEYLMCFDIENKFKNCTMDLKKELMTNPNYRLIVIKNDDTVANWVVVKKNKNDYQYKILIDDSYDYSNIIKSIDNDIKKSNIFKDPNKIYNTKQILNNEEDYFKAYSIYNKAFDTANLIVADFKSIIRNYIDKTIYIGRDYFVLTSEDDDKLYIEYIARHNEDAKNNIGSSELYDQVINIINSTDKKIEIDCYRTSYYMFCKLASDGLIYIDSDILYDDGKVISYYKKDNVINDKYYEDKLNDTNNFTSDYNNSRFYNDIVFFSVSNMKLDEKDRLELEKQKLIYREVIKRLDISRKKAKYRDLNISNLNIKSNYTKEYTSYILNKCSLGNYTISDLAQDIKRKGI